MLLLAATSPIAAGVTFTAETTTSGDKQKTEKVIVKSYVQGPKARIEFRQAGDNPMVKSGYWLVTKDSGENIYLVNPEEQTYMRWNMEQMAALVGGMGQMFNIKFENAKVEKLEESSGKKILGHNTSRYKVRTTYDLSVKMLGIKRQQSVETLTETWTTNAYPNDALSVWLRNFKVTGIEGLDEILEEAMTAYKGIPLHTRETTITRNWNKKRTKVKRETKSTSETIVTNIQKENHPDSLFEIDPSFNEATMGNGPGGMPNLNNIFNRKGNQ